MKSSPREDGITPTEGKGEAHFAVLKKLEKHGTPSVSAESTPTQLIEVNA